MGYLLFRVEAIVTSVLFVALGLALSARVNCPIRRWIVRFVFAAAVVVPWAAILCLFVFMHDRMGSATPWPTQLPVDAMLFMVGVGIVWWRGVRRVPGELQRRVASEWRPGKLALAWVVASLLMFTTFWNLDLAVRQDMAALRVEAGAIALSVTPPRVPDSQNAAILYRQALESLKAEDKPDKGWGIQVGDWLDPDGGKGRFDPNNGEMNAFLDKHRPTIDLLRRAGQLPGCDFGVRYNPPSMETAIPHLGHTRELGRLLCLSARVNAARGRGVEAMKDLNASFALADHCTVEPTLIGTLVAVALEDQSFRTLQEVLAGDTLAGESFDAVAISPAVSFNDAFCRSVQMEEAFGLSCYLAASTSSLRSIWVASGSNEKRMGMFSVLGGSALYRVFLLQDDLAAYRAGMQRYKDLSSRPYHISRDGWDQFGKQLETSRKRPGGILVSLLLPAFSRIAEQVATADARHRVALLAGAMWHYRLQRWAFPDKLESLVPDFIPAVPADPFTGKSMILGKTDDGRTVIYSVGPDLKDDGGKPLDKDSKKGDISLVVGK